MSPRGEAVVKAVAQCTVPCLHSRYILIVCRPKCGGLAAGLPKLAPDWLGSKREGANVRLRCYYHTRRSIFLFTAQRLTVCIKKRHSNVLNSRPYHTTSPLSRPSLMQSERERPAGLHDALELLERGEHASYYLNLQLTGKSI
jgi:hypothetical protein